MGMFKNVQKITTITFTPKPTHNFCPLGQLYCDEMEKSGSPKMLPHYTNHFTITFQPGEVICDYLDVERWLLENINDKNLTIEDAVAMLYDHFMETYKPKYLLVTTEVTDALHGAVKARKESFC